jgi:hypothetical protein
VKPLLPSVESHVHWRIFSLLAGASVVTAMWACGGGTNLTTSPTGCAATLSPTSQNAAAAGGTYAVSITVSQGCEWSAVSTESWVTMMRGSGSGSGSAAYTIAPNTTSSGRSARIRVGDEAIAVTQSPADCTYSVDPSFANVHAAGGTIELRVETKDGCTWSAATHDPWISLPVTTGGGAQTLAVMVAANTSGSQRSGAIEVGGQAIAVTQDATPQAVACGVTLSGRTFTVPADGGSVEIGVTIGPGCSWRTQGLPDWVQTNLEGGSSSARPVFTVAPNSGRSARTATFRIADQSVTITQPGVGCSYVVSPGLQTVAHAGGTVQFTVTAAAGCQWSASSTDAWIRVTPANGSGSGTVSVTAAANPTATSRSGTVEIADRAVRAEQGAAPCRYALGSGSGSVGVDGGDVSFAVDTLDGCAWKATSTEGWIQITSGSGNRRGTARATVTAYSGATERRGSIAVEGLTFIVTQSACTYRGTWVSTATGKSGRIEDTMTAAATPDTLVVTVDTGKECSWRHSRPPDWIPGVAAAEYKGRADFKLPLTCNATREERRGSMSIAGREVGIVQPFDPTGRCVR